MADDVDQDTVQDIVSQRKTLLASQPPEPTQTTDASAGIPRQKRQLSPQSTSLSFSPPPELRQYNAPLPQKDEYSSTFDVFKDPMVVLAGLSSLFTRRPLVNAMNYAAGAMKGFHQGQEDVFRQNKEKFDEAIKATIEQNQIELRKYNAAWDRRKEFNWQKTAPNLYAEAARNNDQILMAAIQSGNWDLVEKIMVGKETAQNALQRASDVAQIKADIAAEQKGGTPVEMASNIVDGMERGDEPPITTGLGNLAGPVKNEASKRKFNLAQAQISWFSALQHARTMAGPQMTKYLSLSESVKNTIGEVLDLSDQLQLGKYPAKNRADLIWLVQTQGGTPQGDLAVKYLGAIKTLKEEFANLAQGGGVPTEPAWALANEQINQDFGVSSLKASLTEVRRLIGYRVEAIKQVGQQGYSPAGNQATPAGGIIRYDSQGNRVQ